MLLAVSPERVFFSPLSSPVVERVFSTNSFHVIKGLITKHDYVLRVHRDPEPFDWYQRYNGVKDLIHQYIKEHDHILMLGCGNSRLTEEMYDDGKGRKMSHCTVPDYRVGLMQRASMFQGTNPSSTLTTRVASLKPWRRNTVITKDYSVRKTVHLKCMEISFVHFVTIFFLRFLLSGHTMDCTSLDFPDANFEAIIDKATMDCLLCGEESTTNVSKMLTEVSRVLKPDGVFFVITYGTPENRLSYLEQEEYQWSVSVHTVSKPDVGAAAITESSDGSGVHYIYVCKKKSS